MRDFPKPLITVQMASRVMTRNVAFITPESKLLIAVLSQAFADTQLDKERASAIRFFRSVALDWICDPIGLEPGFIKEIAVKGGFVPESFLNSEGD
jgi:hypothetical protein